MPLNDFMTPLEKQQPPSLAIRRPKPGGKRHSGRPSVSPGSQCFDVSTTNYNYPGAPTFQPRRTPTPPPVRPDVLELSHCSSRSPACETNRGSPHCYRCGPIPEISGLNAETNDCCVCATITRETESPDAPSPGSTDKFSRRSHVLHNHHHIRHSLFYQPILLSTDHVLGTIAPPSDPLRTESTPIRMESNLLKEECNPLEVDSHPLEHEAVPLEEAHGYEDPYYPGAEERLSSHKVSLEDWDNFCRVQKARSEVWIKNEKALSTSTTQMQDNEVGMRHLPKR